MRVFKNQKTLILLAPIIIIIGLIIALAKQNNLRLDKKTLQDLKPNILESNEITEYKTNWADKNSWIPLKGYSFSGRSDLDEKSVKLQSDLVNSYFKRRGFKTNVDNTFESDEIYGFGSLGYEKGDIKCLMTLYTSSDPSGGYFCGTVDAEQVKLREEFNNDFGQAPRGENETEIVHIDKVLGNFATGIKSHYYKKVYEPSGTHWVAVKIDGKWTIISDGQQYPSCSKIDQYGVPKEIYGNCLLDDKDYEPRFKN